MVIPKKEKGQSLAAAPFKKTYCLSAFSMASSILWMNMKVISFRIRSGIS